MISLLQAGYYADTAASHYSAATTGMFFLIIAIGVIGYIVQARLQSVFKKYSKVQFPGGLTGAEVAEKQHARGYAPLALRSQLVPVVQFASSSAMWVIMLGLVILATTRNELLCWIGVGMIAVSALFSLITLPVEYNASARALEWLQVSRTMSEAQLSQAREALSWAARTYLVAALSAVASVLYYVLLILGGRRD